jgi:undecaprenyl diphosphate synthase
MTPKARPARLPRHIGMIPDGNRRWAELRGLRKEEGYAAGIPPALEVYEICRKLGIKEVSCYGFTQENTKRPAAQVKSFRKAVVDAVEITKGLDASLLIVGDAASPLFPPELLPYTRRTRFGAGTMKINVLVNYSWRWDLAQGNGSAGPPTRSIASHDVSPIDLVIRWGGRRRLSGFLPIQSAYADIFVLDELWPDFRPAHIDRALRWYAVQDITRGG